MGILDSLGDVLKNYIGGQTQNTKTATEDFNQVAQTATHNIIAEGLAAAFRSNQTPQFDWKFIQPVEWRTESWNFKASTCISGPGVLAQVAGSPLFQGLSENVGQQQVTPEQAQAVSPEVVQQLATHAEK